MRLTVIGASGSFPGPGSPASCYLLTAQGPAEDGGTRPWRILLDLGNGALGVLQRHIRLDQIDGVLLSHLHPDHCMDLCGLHVAVRWHPDGWSRGRIPVLGPAATADRLAEAYGMDPDPGMHPDFAFTTWRPGHTETLGPFSITPHPVRHPIEEAYALRVSAEVTGEDGTVRTRVLTYSGDTDECEGLVEAARDADLFLCEAAFHEGRDDALRGVHLTGLRAGQAASQAGARSLLLTHLPVWNDPAATVREASAAYDGPLSVAASGLGYRV
ncbi:MBL fold metallo-hydrolase [Micrococcus sp.]|uniref:MBL fold metallo-hydrolase n=1 Tax=Micrococcus sp. TaxID=1271 RepID=UPI002A916107|nr:MBL fold metallo-hydrolase [Micrococcus sp.]MDY6055702.1 MBL fold metallo-hydrolase [Micrococcus sp.]